MEILWLIYLYIIDAYCMEFNLLPLMDLKTPASSAESEVYNKSLFYVSYTYTGQILISMKYEKKM